MTVDKPRFRFYFFLELISGFNISFNYNVIPDNFPRFSKFWQTFSTIMFNLLSSSETNGSE